jgi:uncharacterized protein YgfB (UPF0149 family)
MSYKSKSDPLGLRQHDPVQQWRDYHDRRDEEIAQARGERKQEEQRREDAIAANEAAQLRYVFEARLAVLEERNAELESALAEWMRAVRHGLDALADQRVDLSSEQREELRDLRAEVAKLHSTLAEMREERAKGFQFAREKDAVADLPNFLPQRRIVN